MKQQRNTRQKQLVLETVRGHKDHPTADQIYLEVREIDEKISRGTVYRNLNQLSESGELTHVRVPSADRFDRRLDLHYHLFCINCGAVYDAPLTYHMETDSHVSEVTGFDIKRHRMVFEGICQKCQSKN